MRKIGSLLLASVLALATHVAMAKTTFNLSTPDPDTSEITLAAKKFAEIVAAKTGGEVEVKVFPNGQLYGGDPSAAVRQLSGGSLDMLLAVQLALRQLQPEIHGHLGALPFRRHGAAALVPVGPAGQ